MAGVGSITGTVPDVVSMTLGISEAMAPDKGFAYNLCTFQIDLREKEQNQQSVTTPASMAKSAPYLNSASSSPQQEASAASASPAFGPDVDLQTAAGPVILVVATGAPGESGGVRDAIVIGIRELATRDRIAGVVELRSLEDFDTGILNSLAIEVAVQEQQIVPQGVLLAIKGFINPAGFGYAHFIGAVLLRAKSGNRGRPSLESKAQFISQAPPRKSGTGIFGQVIETYASGPHLRVRMYKAPLFSP